MALEKATITNAVTGERVPVLFNPEEYTVNRENHFAQITVPGLQSPLLQFVSGSLQTLELELLVDTLEAHREGGRTINEAGDDVRILVRRITGLLDIDRTTHAPPVLLFAWASLSFTCVLARANQRFIMFRADGTPVRARLQVTFNEFTNAEVEARQIKRETAGFSKYTEVLPKDTLSRIAARVYGRPALWVPLALANRIDDPRTLAPGQQLTVPRLPYRDPETGEVYR
jgi:LysM repeat protein